jgi:hypothetical protein
MLKRLKKRSFRELKARAGQGVHMAAERLRLWPKDQLPASIDFFTSEGTVRDRDLTAEAVRKIVKPKHVFYPSVLKLEECCEVLRERWPGEEDRIISTADRVCEGRFDLLGYKDLYFGGAMPNWHYDPISRKASPEVHWSRIDEVDATATGDKKIIWELSRHQYFVVLGQAYVLTGNEKYAECFAQLISNWMDSNPPKVGVNWLSSLELAFRSISWIWAFHLFRYSPSLTPELVTRMTKFLCAFGRHIETYLSTYFSPNTHLTGEALGLYFLGSFLPETADAEEWKRVGYKVLVDALDFQVRPDGTYCEQASHYLRYTIDFYCTLLLLRRLEGNGPEPLIETKLNRLFDCLIHIGFPNGESPGFGDDDGGRLHFLDADSVTSFRSSAAVGAVLLGRGDLKSISGEASPELLWLLGSAGLRDFDSLPASEPPERVRAFRDGGIFAARSGWTDSADSILIDCGPHGFMNGGHAHADALSFVMAIDGMPVFVDSGTYNYTAEPEERNRFRSSQAHNCLTVNGRGSSTPAGPFSWNTTADARLIEWTDEGARVVFRGAHDGFAELGVSYERRIEIYFKDCLFTVEDVVESVSENLYEIHLILSPQFRVEILDSPASAVIKSVTGEAIMRLDTTVAGTVRDDIGWQREEWTISPVYGERVKTEKLVYRIRGSGKLPVLTRFAKVKVSG